MSKRETEITRYYWDTHVGGLLVEEFCLVASAAGCGRRCVDALILPGREKRIASRGENVEVNGQKVVLVQTKASRLGMSLMGQTLFSVKLFRERFNAASVLSVALCTGDDRVLRVMLEEHQGCRVVVISTNELKNAAANRSGRGSTEAPQQNVAAAGASAAYPRAKKRARGGAER